MMAQTTNDRRRAALAAVSAAAFHAEVGEIEKVAGVVGSVANLIGHGAGQFAGGLGAAWRGLRGIVSGGKAVGTGMIDDIGKGLTSGFQKSRAAWGGAPALVQAGNDVTAQAGTTLVPVLANSVTPAVTGALTPAVVAQADDAVSVAAKGAAGAVRPRAKVNYKGNFLKTGAGAANPSAAGIVEPGLLDRAQTWWAAPTTTNIQRGGVVAAGTALPAFGLGAMLAGGDDKTTVVYR